MTKLDAMIAPRALTIREVAEVLSPHLISYGVSHRAFTFADLWDSSDAGATSAAETAMVAIEQDAHRSLDQWLGDVQNDGEPRFFQKVGLRHAVKELLGAAGQYFAQQSAESGVKVLISQLEDRDEDVLLRLIDIASRS